MRARILCVLPAVLALAAETMSVDLAEVTTDSQEACE